MYSIVLMVAMTSGGDVPATHFGGGCTGGCTGYSCNGCHGGHKLFGGHGCCGGHSHSHGCCGGGFFKGMFKHHHSCHGCCGGYVAPACDCCSPPRAAASAAKL